MRANSRAQRIVRLQVVRTIDRAFTQLNGPIDSVYRINPDVELLTGQ